jgi:hypothetical protein
MRFTVAVSIGYFAHDLVVVLKYPSLYDPAIVAHHVVIGGFFALGIIDHSYTPFHFLFLLGMCNVVEGHRRNFPRK